MHHERAEQSGRFEEQGESRSAEAVMTVLEETVSLFFRLRAVLEDIHGHSDISGSMRGVMRELKHHGPLTVPQMARRRPVSRQHIQAIVNDLQRAGLASLAANPRHKRSKIVQLTLKGEEALNHIIEREHAVLNQMEIPVSVEELRETRDVLVKLRAMMESPAWRQTVRSVLYQDGDTPDNPWIDESEDFAGPGPAPPRVHRN